MLIRFLRHHRRGESILETVIAMTILAIGISLASTIMGSSIRSMNASKNRIIAISIAREGLEAIRNIRDTNWLKFNSKKRECWNNSPGEETPDTCDGTNPIEPGEYIIFKQPIDSVDTSKGWKWRLGNTKAHSGSIATATGVTKGDNFYDSDTKMSYVWNGTLWVDLTQLYLVDIDPLVDSDQDHDYTNDADAYNHAWVEGDIALGKEHSKKSPFRRTVTISYLANDGKEITDPNDMTKQINRMRIRTTVPWQEGKFQFKTELATTLTDYQGRENLDN